MTDFQTFAGDSLVGRGAQDPSTWLSQQYFILYQTKSEQTVFHETDSVFFHVAYHMLTLDDDLFGTHADDYLVKTLSLQNTN